MVQTVEEIAKLLQEESVKSVQKYCDKLRPNWKNCSGYRDLLSEAYAALMFARSGFNVEMRESPDLRLEYRGLVIGAEVTRFRRKVQDGIDDQRMKGADDSFEKMHNLLAKYGDTVPTEGKKAWEQVEEVAKKKCSQLCTGIPNVLVIESSSPNCIEDTEIQPAVDSLTDQNASGIIGDTGKLNGIVFLSLQYNVRQHRSVYFFEICNASVPLPDEARQALDAITEWKTG